MTQPPYEPQEPTGAVPPPPPPPPAQYPGAGAPAMAPGYPVAPQSPYAPWVHRLGGYLLDEVFLIPFTIVGMIGTSIAGGTDASSGTQAIGFIVAAVGYLGLLAFAVWNVLLRQGRTGQSLGKQVVGIRLVSEATGQPIGACKVFLRGLAHILDALPCYLGYFWPLWDAKRQTFADKIMKTVVLR